MRTVHLPSIKGRPACGVRRGLMAREVVGARRVQLGTTTAADLGRTTQPDVTCQRCLDAMLYGGSPVIRQRWRFWIAAAASGRVPDAAAGSEYLGGTTAM